MLNRFFHCVSLCIQMVRAGSSIPLNFIVAAEEAAKLGWLALEYQQILISRAW